VTDMHFTCGQAIGNSQEAHYLHAEHYPQCIIPSHKLFTKLHQQPNKSLSFAPWVCDHGRPS